MKNISVSLDTGERLSLGFVPVATEDAGPLLDVIIQILKEIHELYSIDIERDEIFIQLLSKITSICHEDI